MLRKKLKSVNKNERYRKNYSGLVFFGSQGTKENSQNSNREKTSLWQTLHSQRLSTARQY